MNEFIASLMMNFSMALGYNPFLTSGMAIFFIFGLIYVLGLPRYLSIPASMVAVYIVFEFTAGIGFLAAFAVGLGLGFLLYITAR